MSQFVLSINNISYKYKKNKASAISNFSLNVNRGSFTTILGPSGCGKTTLLRLIAGFTEPDSGTIYIEGRDQSGIAPNKRKVGMVFQDYALFPHLTVRKNIMYGLKVRHSSIKMTKASMDSQVDHIAHILSLNDLLDRYPHELSGGQQQRVALARSLVLKPSILLMDEPLSSLDTNLRERLCEELKDIQARLRITTIYVTHNQKEALSMSDNIAVINKGTLLQCGSPRELYFNPEDRFTADFFGRTNFIERVNKSFMVRPEWFSLCSSGQADIKGVIDNMIFLGDTTRLYVKPIVDSSAALISPIPTIYADISSLEAVNLSKDQIVNLKILHKSIIK